MNFWILILLLPIAWAPKLYAQSPFYQGKSIRLIVGTTAGSNYDMYARLLAQFYGKHRRWKYRGRQLSLLGGQTGWTHDRVN